MEISREAVSQTGRVGAVPMSGRTGATAAISGGRAVQLSDSARLMAELVQLARAAEVVRSDKVMALRQQLSDGSYQVGLEQLADEMLQEP